MSKFIDRLRRASEGVVQPMGFSAIVREKVPSLILLAKIDKPTKDLVAGAVKNGAEFILFHGKEGAMPAHLPPSDAGQTPWGVRVSSLTVDEYATLQGAGCDFALISLVDTPARLLAEEEVGIVVAVPTGLEDRILRAVDQLPCDAALIDIVAASDDELTVQRLLDYTIIASGISQSLIAPVSPRWGRREIEQLRDIGLAGVVIDVASEDDLKGLKAVRDAVLALPSRGGKKREERLRARLPQIAPGRSQPPDSEPDEDDDDE